MKKEWGRFGKEGKRKRRSIRRTNEVVKEGKFWKKSRQVVARINEEYEERKCREESEVEEERRRRNSLKITFVEDR